MKGEVLRRLRLKLVGTQEVFAEHLDVSRTTVSDWERGAAPVPHTVALLMRLWEKNPKLVNRVMETTYEDAG